MSSDAPRVFSQNWLWAFPPVYLIHLVDERFWPPGTANWATANSFLYFTNEAWLWVNVPSMLVVLLATALISARRLPEWVTVAMGLNVALHAFMRIGGTLFFGSVSPGLATGVILCLPLALPVLVRGMRLLPRADFIRGLAWGVASFQPVWHLLVYPFLPLKPG